MSQKNQNKCYTLVQLIVSAHNNADEDDFGQIGARIAGGDHGAFDSYMSQKNQNKCYTLVQLIVSAHNNADEDDFGQIGARIAGGVQFYAIREHIQKCSSCKNHPLLK
eukprot:TRINITY_DN10863_c0_g1_i1.p1 TRINITY_DN10863_c0_g1~~TRINITY_DN10863_c0_g1_i1.p1  ORF type:complete len:123 (+),score=19.21 TRINITY_DN10863_c0_g1_i1:47-370(+)